MRDLDDQDERGMRDDVTTGPDPIDRWRASPEEAAAFDALDAAYIAADAAYEAARDAWMAEHKEEA